MNAVPAARLGDAPCRRPSLPARPPSGSRRSHSHPLWLVERWLERFGAEDAERLLRWNNSRPRLVLQPARASLEALERRWRAAGIAVEPAPYGAGLVTDRRRPRTCRAIAEGAFHRAGPGPGAARPVRRPSAGRTVYDACAAPGGKTIALGRAAERVVAGDVSRARVRRLAENLRRAGSGREYAVVADARRPPLRQVDAVLLDAPCLGTGTFARHPDARWRVTPEALGHSLQRQAELLDRAATAVAPGGLLVYATCSLEPEENGRAGRRVPGPAPEFRREPSATVPAALLSPEGDLMILPHRDEMDGAFGARLRRAA